MKLKEAQESEGEAVKFLPNDADTDGLLSSVKEEPDQRFYKMNERVMAESITRYRHRHRHRTENDELLLLVDSHRPARVLRIGLRLGCRSS